MSIEWSVLVIGSGPIGLLAAKLFASFGAKVTILERKSKEELLLRTKPSAQSRLFALTLASYDLMVKSLKVPLSKKELAPIKKIFVNEDEANSVFTPDLINQAQLGYMIEEHLLFKAILKDVEKNNQIKFVYNVKLEGICETDYNQYAMLDSNDHTYKANLIIAADGRNSAVRSWLGIDCAYHNWHEKGVIFEIKHDFSHEGLAVETFLPSGPLAILPQYDQSKSSIVWSLPTDQADAFLALPKSQQQELLQAQLIDQYKGSEIISPCFAYSLEQIIPEKLFCENVLLLGDAAHAMHPVAGQGFNVGVKDLEVLFHILSKYHPCGLLPCSLAQLLYEYETKRKNDITIMVESTYILCKLFLSDFLPIKFMRKVGLSIFDKIDLLKRNVIKYATGYGNKI